MAAALPLPPALKPPLPLGAAPPRLQAAMSQVQVNNVPTSASPEELRQLFAQLGQVKSLLTSFEANKAEGTVSQGQLGWALDWVLFLLGAATAAAEQQQASCGCSNC